MKPRSKRLMLLAGALVLLLGAAALVVTAMRQNLVYFYTPIEVSEGKAPVGRTFRIGGMVEAGSVQRDPDGLSVRFIITDTAKKIPVSYHGTLPDLFREGQGAVAQGKLGPDGLFTASEVLAKHDENYTPIEAQYALDQAHNASKTLQQ